jgi:hypothetical protein
VTSTTIPGGECGQVPSGPSFVSIACRLTALAGETAATSTLGDLRGDLQVSLGKATQRTDEARTSCAASERKKARRLLKQAIRALIQYSHRLRSRAARKNVDRGVLDPFAAQGDAIQDDARALRIALQCPQDARYGGRFEAGGDERPRTGVERSRSAAAAMR